MATVHSAVAGGSSRRQNTSRVSFLMYLLIARHSDNLISTKLSYHNSECFLIWDYDWNSSLAALVKRKRYLPSVAGWCREFRTKLCINIKRESKILENSCFVSWLLKSIKLISSWAWEPQLSKTPVQNYNAGLYRGEAHRTLHFKISPINPYFYLWRSQAELHTKTVHTSVLSWTPPSFPGVGAIWPVSAAAAGTKGKKSLVKLKFKL